MLRLQQLMTLRHVLVGREGSVLIDYKGKSGKTIYMLVDRGLTWSPHAIRVRVYRRIEQAESRWFDDASVARLARLLRRQYRIEEGEHHSDDYLILNTAFDSRVIPPSRTLARLGYLLEEFELVSTGRQ